MSDAIALPSPLIEVRRAAGRGRGGRGVFARVDIAHGTLVERAPVLLVPAAEMHDDALLSWYDFDWRNVNGRDEVAVALGCASLYNHGWPANATWEQIAPDLIEITAHRDIPAGGEIFINYHGEPDDPEPFNFEHPA